MFMIEYIQIIMHTPDFVADMYQLILPIYVRIISLALGQSYDCPSASEVILQDMGKWIIWNHWEQMV